MFLKQVIRILRTTSKIDSRVGSAVAKAKKVADAMRDGEMTPEGRTYHWVIFDQGKFVVIVCSA